MVYFKVKLDNWSNLKKLLIIFSLILSFFSFGFSSSETIRVDFDEKVSSSNYFNYFSNSKDYHTNYIEYYNMNNLELYLPFNYNNISNKDDYSSNGFEFGEFGGIIWNSLGCYDNSGCYEFDGVDDYLEITNSTPLTSITSEVTLSVWAKVKTHKGWAGIISFVWDTGSTESGFYISSSSGYPDYQEFRIKTDTMAAHDFGAVGDYINTNQWYHFVGTYDGNFTRFYINGVEVASDVNNGTIDWNPEPYNLYVGRYKDDDEEYYFDGQIDEVRIYNKSLTNEEIMRIYQGDENKYSGQIVVSNVHLTEPVYDVEVFVNQSDFISTPWFSSGKNGFISNNSFQDFTLFIPELNVGESSIFNYDIFPVKSFPILINSSNSDKRVMSGGQFSVSDEITNIFDNNFGQNGCLYNVSIFQNAIELTGESSDRIKFDTGSFSGSGAGDVSVSGDEFSFNWDVSSGGCFNISDSFKIDYDVLMPSTAFSGVYNISNTTLNFTMLDSFSGVSIDKILGISNANISLEKEIVNFSSTNFSDSNVTWSVNSSFFTNSVLNYELNKATVWVSQKNVNSIYADPNTFENDSVNNSVLQRVYVPNSVVNLSNPWVSNDWNFNFSGFDNPMVWFDVDFTLLDDGVQLKNSKGSGAQFSNYLRGVSFISGYWLDINKSFKSVSNDTYEIKIKVSNKGTIATPANSIVTIYDLIPSGFSLSGSIIEKPSAWYDIDISNNSVSGELSGEFYQFGIIPTNLKNVSLDSDVGLTDKNSVEIIYNITGSGEYNYLDVFITGLDPQKVEGAGSTKTIGILQQFIENKFENLWLMVSSAVLFILIILI